MTETTPVHTIHPEINAEDALTTLIREGAREVLAAALEAEINEHIDRLRNVVDADVKRRVVRNDFLPEREIQTGAGNLPIRQPRARVRGEEEGEKHLRFQSKLIPPYLREAMDIEELIPWLYLRGVSTNDMQSVMSSLLGVDAGGLSPTSIARCNKVWEQQVADWEKRSLLGKRYVYVWADGVYFNVRLIGERACVLVLIGATEDGRKEILPIGDGALSFWKAVSKAWPQTRHQRCWSHKSMNVLSKMPKSSQNAAKGMLHDIWMAEKGDDPPAAYDLFVSTYEAKLPRAVECLVKDKTEMLAFYDFPAEHWRHLRTSNPIESLFSTVSQRTSKTKGCGSRAATLSMVFKLAMSAQGRWRRLNGHEQLGALIEGVQFKDGIKQKEAKGDDAAA